MGRRQAAGFGGWLLLVGLSTLMTVVVTGSGAAAAAGICRLPGQPQEGRPSLVSSGRGGEAPLALGSGFRKRQEDGATAAAGAAPSPPPPPLPLVLGRRRARCPLPSSSFDASRLLSGVRGGVTKATTKSKVTARAAASAGATNKIRFATEQTFRQKVRGWYRRTPTITRLHLTAALVLTALGTVVIDPSYFLLDPMATVAGLQLWRPFTAAAFLGPPSMSWASNIYFLHQYGACVGCCSEERG